MDLKLTPEDRVAGNSGKKKSKRAKPAANKSGGAKSARKPAGKTAGKTASKTGAKGKVRRTRAKKARQPLTLGRVIGRTFYWGLVLSVWGFIAIAGVVAYYGLQLPAANTWKVPERAPNIRIVAADGQLISNRGKMGGEAVSIDELPYYVPEAFISIEDRRFMSHWGLDPIGILGAMRINVMAGRSPFSGHGGSTITQQVAKNLFLTPEQTIGRKIQEALLALWLEHTYTKEQILGLYLNRMYFGAGAHGIEAASERYFGKSARNLSLGEAAILAGVLKAPSALSPDTHPQAAAARARLVLNAMAEEGYISKAEAKAAAISDTDHLRTKVLGSESYVADWVETLMQSYIGKVDQDVVVTTTIDWNLQKQAEFAVKDMVAQNGKAHHFSQGALVSMSPDGAVRAIVGGVDYAKSQYDRAVTARRQTGSTFKPFVYLTALQDGYTPQTVIDDAPLDYNGWKPENAEHKYFGPVPLKTALAYSLNTVAARLSIAVGPKNVVETARRMGISSPLQPVPSIALGTQSLSLLELTAAYAPFANGGQGVIAHVITKIATPDGKVLYQASPAGPGRVMTPEQVGMMDSMLAGAVEIGTGKRAKLPGWPIGGKTGTTQDDKDAVFVGFSSHMITGVWLGNDDSSPMSHVSGGSFPAEIWSEVMQKAHQGLAPTPLPDSYDTPMDAVATTPQQPAQPGDKPRTVVDLLKGIFGG